MDENLTDQQQAEKLRIWLRENGWYLLGGLALGVAGIVGMRQWEAYTTTKGENAAALYAELNAAVRAERTGRAEEIAQQLVSEYGSTPYVDQARLALAKMKLQRSQPDEAGAYLRQVIKDSGSPEIAHIARLRLARVLASAEKYDEALGALEVPKESAFSQRYHEVRGDVFYLMGRFADARTEYETALKGEQFGGVDVAFVQAKLDDVGGAAPAAGADGATVPPAQ